MAKKGARMTYQGRGLGDIEAGEDLAGGAEQADGLGTEAFGFGGA